MRDNPRNNPIYRMMAIGLSLLWGVGLGLMLWVGSPNLAWAAEAASSDSAAAVASDPPPEPVSSGTNAISSEKVSQFVHAYLQVLALIEQREGELHQAETISESRQLEQAIQTQAFAIIAEAGLTQQEYMQLLGLANTDPDFSDRILAQLQEARP